MVGRGPRTLPYTTGFFQKQIKTIRIETKSKRGVLGTPPDGRSSGARNRARWGEQDLAEGDGHRPLCYWPKALQAMATAVNV